MRGRKQVGTLVPCQERERGRDGTSKRGKDGELEIGDSMLPSLLTRSISIPRVLDCLRPNSTLTLLWYYDTIITYSKNMGKKEVEVDVDGWAMAG